MLSSMWCAAVRTLDCFTAAARLHGGGYCGVGTAGIGDVGIQVGQICQLGIVCLRYTHEFTSANSINYMYADVRFEGRAAYNTCGKTYGTQCLIQMKLLRIYSGANHV